MKNLKEKIEVMQAYLDGAKIQFKTQNNSAWEYCTVEPLFEWNKKDYRIKPKPMEIWVNVYDGGALAAYHDKDGASSRTSIGGKAVKFREVIE